MANYSYLRNLARPLSVEEFEQRLVEAVEECFPGRLAVTRADWDSSGLTWWVYVPGSAVEEKEAIRRNWAPGEDFGFTAELEDRGRTVAFRHGPSDWKRWVLGCVAETLAESLDVGRYFDADDSIEAPGTRIRRDSKTLWQYITAGYGRPLPKGRLDLLRECAQMCPPGWEPTPEEMV